ncbi:hypothetical protein [Bacillus thuringiensis]|uniref:hypothetical protein n=1 Tax=Bacillus thuringiensis TaxID=1428 RepID=UPI0021D65500|nr:hypothetical protein [Bacillus thuringiensis]MCU7667541.1 hypothetical protein [Bacillus thuringiensis]
MDRITDLLIGLVIGFYLPKTVNIFGINVHWAIVLLLIVISLRLLKKLAAFLWKKKGKKLVEKLITKLAKMVKDEIQKDDDLAV